MIPAHAPRSKRALYQDALEYAAIGWSIIPTRDKKAACKWRAFQKQRPDPEQVLGLFNRPNVTGLAVILGPVSGNLACRDFDIQDSYTAWANAHPKLARVLPTVAAARGAHVYFRSEGTFGTQRLPDGELRGSGGYCLLPPSQHPDGPIYRWLIQLPDGPLPVLDPAKVGLGEVSDIHPTQHTTHCASDVSGTHGLDPTMPTGPGQRHFALLALVRTLKVSMPAASPRELLPILQLWHQKALPFIRTKDFAVSWQELLAAWRSWNPQTAELQQAIARADAIRIPNHPHHTPAARHLLCLCAALQEQYGDRPFFLGCRLAGELLGLDRCTANKLLGQLRHEGFLELVSKGSQATGKASEWHCGPFAWGTEES